MGQQLTRSIGLAVAVVTVATLTLVGVILRLLLAEIVRIYQRHAFGHTRQARLLWGALGTLGLTMLTSLALVWRWGTSDLVYWLTLGALAVWFVFIEIVDLSARPPTSGDDNLDQVLEPWIPPGTRRDDSP